MEGVARYQTPQTVVLLGTSCPNFNQKPFCRLLVCANDTRESRDPTPSIGEAIVIEHRFQQRLSTFVQDAPRAVLKPVDENISREREQGPNYGAHQTYDAYPECGVSNDLLRDLISESSCIHFQPMEWGYW